jgi:sulfite reductase (NADPH) flavoprotein alpha-component
LQELTQVPDLGSLFEGVQSLVEGDWTGAILLSETAEEGSKVGTGVAHSLTGAGFDLIHVFDGLTAGRELSALAASTKVDSEGQSIETILEKAGVSYFSYEGSATATQVIVLPASTYSSCAKAALAALTPSSVEVGILTVHVVKPWSADTFIAALPASTKALHVYKSDESHISPFHTDILTSLLSPPGFKLKMRSLATSASTVPTVLEWASTIANLSSASPASSPASADAVIPTIKSLLPEQSKLAVFWDLDASTGQTELVPQALAQAFAASNTGVSAKLSTKYDNFSQGGIQLSSLLLESNEAISHAFTLDALVATTPPSLLFISSPAVFKSYEPISASTVAASTRVVISAKWTKDEVAAKLPTSARKALASVFAASKGSIYVVDADALAAAHSIPAKEVSEIVFWSLYLPSTISAKEIVTILAGTPTFAGFKHDCLVEINSAVRNAIIQVEVPSTWSEDAMVVDGAKVEEEKTFPTLLHATAAGPNADRTFSDPLVEMIGGSKKSWHQVAQSLIFPQAFGRTNDTEERMRPDLPEKNFMVTVTENRRLTPTNYDRNVFHLEFSTAGTGLKYSVGEALGIHGWNDSAEVSEFLEWYGLDPEAIVSAPAREDSSRVEQRTIFQMFQQSLDIFGKPSKSFYDNLSAHATSINESRALRFIACADGAATFKKMSEVDTLTYADVFRMFPSAKMPIDVLVKEVEEIKPRHYSIASSQNFVGDQVHLLIVTVDWVDPKGTSRIPTPPLENWY